MDHPLSAMIFAAGFGTRMGALTRDVPKPMVKLAGRPMVDYAIDLLRDAGVQNIAANTHYLSDAIRPHLEAQDILTSYEADVILDTGGGLRAALPLLGDGPVITLNPDVLWLGQNPIEALLQAWQPDMRALLMLVPQSNTIGVRREGDFSLEHGEIRRKGPYIYGGAQIIQTTALCDIEHDVFSLNAYWDHLNTLGPLNGIAHEGRWCDIGNPDGLAAAEGALQGV